MGQYGSFSPSSRLSSRTELTGSGRLNLLEQVLDSYDLSKYTFTRKVVIEEGTINHAFPVLTLNVRFARSPDELL